MINQLVLIEADLVGGVLDLVLSLRIYAVRKLSLATLPVRTHTGISSSIETVTSNVRGEKTILATLQV